MADTQIRKEKRKYTPKPFKDKTPAEVTWGNHNYLLQQAGKNNAVWQQNIQEDRKNQMPLIVTIGKNGKMYFNYMRDVNALAAMQQAKEAGYTSNCWLTIDAVQNLNLREKEDVSQKVLGATRYRKDGEKFDEEKVLLVNANNYVGSGLSKMYAALRSFHDIRFRDYQDKIAVSFLKNMAVTVTAEKANAVINQNRENLKRGPSARRKPANIMSVVRTAYNSAVEKAQNMLREDDLQKNSEQYGRREIKTVEIKVSDFQKNYGAVI